MAVAKQPGVILGSLGAANLKPNIEEGKAKTDAFEANLSGLLEGFKFRGLMQRQMVEELNGLGIETARGGEWSLVQLQRLLARIEAAATGKARTTAPGVNDVSTSIRAHLTRNRQNALAKTTLFQGMNANKKAPGGAFLLSACSVCDQNRPCSCC